MKNKENVYCYFLENNPHNFETREFLNSAYASWRENWFQLFEEMGDIKHCSSDEFSRQDYFLVLFFNNEMAGTIGCREIDLSTPMGMDDSYLKPWPKSFKEKYKNEKILLMSGFNLSPKFRSRFMALPSIFIFGTCFMKQFLRTPYDFFITLARNDAGVNKFCERLGAEKVGYTKDFHGKACDLMVFRKENARVYPFKKLEEKLFNLEIQDFQPSFNPISMGA